ncbi:two pore domain potassium channel family protein [Synechococcus sp. Cruz-9H2]|uniref:potassium channel family protein n=1 Tax=unclassified Synechococcus TaxID=2626047 RepID=UPI0020CCCCCD|nr:MULTISPECIES: potassium channel family protein [unclassified Synechococcus]MCP9819206.1 two pore domain potassium channel family protein [Synechococcus sp. Cruz-9H2]MCP9843710.1 two pore domain potassium channel family protein [Synechococcus sp. Edmonson 11F2]MCP9855571.1 two pore domain potassium channel family protein [Synechococcus sp. Cruz-9C9]MCP9863009.1 two pore domain potassium channel family protein [Synechococcus sp. Cruz-7E5]MCP9870116.1 two pore domain potassium channel family p
MRFPLRASLSSEARLRRRHRFYAHLLLITLFVMACLALPSNLQSLGGIGYSLATMLLMVELEGSIRHDGKSNPRDLPYRVLGLLTLLAQWFWYFTPLSHRESGWPLLVLTTLFVGWSVMRLVGFLAEERQVNGSVLMGAISGYLLLGLTAGLLFTALETIQPGSYANLRETPSSLFATGPISTANSQLQSIHFARLNYFAFVCLSTVGFGDVLPTTPFSQMSAVAFSVIGPIYMAIVMGLLIGRYASDKAVRSDRDEPPGE